MKTKWSNFHITVNLNQTTHESAFKGTVRNFAACIEEAIHDHVWDWLVRYDGGQRPFKESEKLLVDRIRARVGMEQDSEGRNRSLHAHVLMEVEHRTMVQVDRTGLKDFIDACLDVSSHVHVRFLKGDSSDKNFILQYISKTVKKRGDGVSGANRRLVRAMGAGGNPATQPIDNDSPV